MLDTVKINHVQHISFTQSRLTDAVSVILSELLSYEHPSNAVGILFCLRPKKLQTVLQNLKVFVQMRGICRTIAAKRCDRPMKNSWKKTKFLQRQNCTCTFLS